MPGRDGTGPMGFGPMTGRGFGFCKPANIPLRGFGRRCGFGQGFGCGMGYGRGFGYRRSYSYGRSMDYGMEFAANDNYNEDFQPLTKEEQKEMLGKQIEYLQKEIEYINKQLEEL